MKRNRGKNRGIVQWLPALFSPVACLLARSWVEAEEPERTLSEISPPEVSPALNDKYKVQEEKIYYGDPKNFHNPAVLDASKIYNEIPAYQKIVQKGLTKNDPEYWPLMQKASNVFVRALKAVCKEKGIDLVGEVSSISCDHDQVPDITEAVIEAVKGDKLADDENDEAACDLESVSVGASMPE
ncbi:MAG: hypothetical protein HY717_06275 [Planctomycetes bacterium]|nr:hypothetical protein [Planctomycetota bacterium]